MSTTDSTGVDAAARPRGGRPRDETIERRVLPVVRDMLIEVGWNELSVRAVATRSGVGRATINRRWASKAELVVDALFADLPTLEAVTGMTRTDWVESVITVSRELFERPDFRSALPGLLSTFDQDPELRHRVWDNLATPATTAFAGVTDREHPDTAEIDAVAILVIASGAALFTSVMPPGDMSAPVRQRIDLLLRRLASGPAR